MNSSCAPAAELRRARPLLGTLVEITAGGLPPQALERAVQSAFAAIARVQTLMSFHDPASDVSRLNRGAARGGRVHAWTHLVLRRAQELHAATAGLFDIATAPALVRGGWLPGAAAPAATTGNAADITLLAGHRVRCRRPLLLDLGGIAKGFAVDRAIAALRRHGATAGCVNAGGDLRIFGPLAEPVHVRRPESPGEFRLLTHLQNAALATSAAYYAARPIGGHACAPIIDPRDGRPSRQAHSVTVQARTCLLADALCKVVWLAGVDAAAPVLRRFRAKAWLFETGSRDRHPVHSPHAA